MNDDTPVPPLVLLGLDGCNPELIERWANEGYLPTIAALMERGCWAKTTGREHIAEHGTFLSLLSGISRKQHGYYYFRQLQPSSYNLQAFSHQDTNVLPFWSSLKGKKVAIIDAPDSNLVPRLPGMQLAEWSVHEAAIQVQPPCAEPASLLADARRIFGPQIPVSEFKTGSTLAEDYQMYRQFLRRIEKKGRLCRELLSGDRYDLVVVGFYEAHTAGHRFWKYRPEVESENTELTHAIRDIYQAIDREMGSLLQQLPDDANVFVLSCFGIKDQYPTTGLIESFCRQLGYQTLLEAAAPSLEPLSIARRLLPESWRAAIGVYLPLQVQERLLADRFRNSTDWSRTTAFAIPSLYTSFIRVNLHGREPQGIVQRGTEYRTILERLEHDLKQLIDPVTGKPAVERIVRTVDWFGCEPPETLPDVFVEWQAARYFMQQVIHPQAKLVQEPMKYHRDSYHSLEGFMVTTGPSIPRQGRLADISLLDLAPTFLALMGESVPEGMAGTVLPAIARS